MDNIYKTDIIDEITETSEVAETNPEIEGDTVNEGCPDNFFQDGNILSNGIRRKLAILGFEKPTEIQRKVIPLTIESQENLLGIARTGSGKTAAFCIPAIVNSASILQQGNHGASVLIISPTRELSMQIVTFLSSFVKNLKIGNSFLRVCSLIGGFSVGKQEQFLRRNVEMIVGTPGRVCLHLHNGSIKFAQSPNKKFIVVLDEVDKMLVDPSFYEQIDIIINSIPQDHQILMFSATFNKETERVANLYLKNYNRIDVREANEPMPSNIQHGFIEMMGGRSKLRLNSSSAINAAKNKNASSNINDSESDQGDSNIEATKSKKCAVGSIATSLESMMDSLSKEDALHKLLECFFTKQLEDGNQDDDIAIKADNYSDECENNNSNSSNSKNKKDKRDRRDKRDDVINKDVRSAIVFVRTRDMTQRISNMLNERGIRSRFIHGDLRQFDRKYILDAFRRSEFGVLVATDVMSRGIDVREIKMVINYDMPMTFDDYVHRVGRGGRCGSLSLAYTFVGHDDARLYDKLRREIYNEKGNFSNSSGSNDDSDGNPRWRSGNRSGRGRHYGGNRRSGSGDVGNTYGGERGRSNDFSRSRWQQNGDGGSGNAGGYGRSRYTRRSDGDTGNQYGGNHHNIDGQSNYGNDSSGRMRNRSSYNHRSNDFIRGAEGDQRANNTNDYRPSRANHDDLQKETSAHRSYSDAIGAENANSNNQRKRKKVWRTE